VLFGPSCKSGASSRWRAHCAAESDRTDLPAQGRAFVVPARERGAAKPAFSACITIEGIFSWGSLMRRWMCSGMTMYPTTAN
jgi:hypothetical protein